MRGTHTSASLMKPGADLPLPRWPTSEQDWIDQKPLIRRLYVDEDRTLNEVMEIMEKQEGFKARYAQVML